MYPWRENEASLTGGFWHNMLMSGSHRQRKNGGVRRLSYQGPMTENSGALRSLTCSSKQQQLQPFRSLPNFSYMPAYIIIVHVQQH